MSHFQVEKPNSPSEFETMCVAIYGVRYADAAPNINGRNGQKQGGVDIFIHPENGGCFGIQCKDYPSGGLTFAMIQNELCKVESAEQAITKLIIATTMASDANLQRQVHQLNAKRIAVGAISVHVDFWPDLAETILGEPILRDRYAPNFQGSVNTRIESGVQDLLQLMHSTIPNVEELNRLVSMSLNDIRTLINQGRYRDALSGLAKLASVKSSIVLLEQANWHALYGYSVLYGEENITEAIYYFEMAYKIYPCNERIASSFLFAKLLRAEQCQETSAGFVLEFDEIRRIFPTSAHVWLKFAEAYKRIGSPITKDRIPQFIRDEPIIKLHLAIEAKDAGDTQRALTLLHPFLGSADIGLQVREFFISIALSICNEGPYFFHFDSLLNQQQQEVLNTAIDSYTPWSEKVWAIQAPQQQFGIVSSLCMALLLLNHNVSAEQLIMEAIQQGISEPNLLALHLEVLIRQQRREDALSLVVNNLDTLSLRSIGIGAELAGKASNLDLLQRLRDHAEALFPSDIGFHRLLNAECIRLQARNAGKNEVSHIVDAANLFMGQGIEALGAAAEVLRWADSKEEANRYENEVLLRLENMPAEERKLSLALAAEIFHKAQKWITASKFYEEHLSSQAMAAIPIQASLLRCYVNSNQRTKARKLLKKIPDGWVENVDLRGQAIELGRQTGDWKMLLPLAEREKCLRPDQAGGWLFLLQITHCAGLIDSFSTLLSELPELLKGSEIDLAKLGLIALQNDHEDQGRRLLYRTLRQNTDNPDLLALVWRAAITNETLIPNAADNNIQAGCWVRYQDARGKEKEFVLDPDNVGDLPKASIFVDINDHSCSPFLGKRIGDEVIQLQNFGIFNTVHVTEIKPAIYYFIDKAMKVAGQHGGLPNMMSFDVIDPITSEPDFGVLKQILDQRRDYADNIMASYASKPIPLGTIGKLLGRPAIELVNQWGSNFPPLKTQYENHDQFLGALKQLNELDKPVVIDSLALAEIVTLNAESALPLLGTLFVTTVTQRNIQDYVDRMSHLTNHNTVGTIFSNGERMEIQEITPFAIKQRQQFSLKLLTIMQQYCTVLPVYGELPEHARLLDILSDEEREVLLLATEKNAAVCSFDANFRSIGKDIVGLDGYWPQLLISSAYEKGVLNKKQYENAMIYAFLNNRSFVSINADIAYSLFSRGGQWLKIGMRQIQKHLSCPNTDLESAEIFVINLLNIFINVAVQQTVFFCFLRHLVCPLLRRPECSTDYANTLTANLELDSRHKYEIQKAIQLALHDAMNQSESPELDVIVLLCAPYPVFQLS